MQPIRKLHKKKALASFGKSFIPTLHVSIPAQCQLIALM